MGCALPSSRTRAIRRRLLDHYDRRRRDLPWRGETDPYRIWVSEIMLQQTRVDTAIPYYRRWLERFPTLDDLAEAEDGEVLAAWSGLGYYHRARNLQAAARIVRDRHAGELPTRAADLRALPGVGPYTAGAVASIAFGRREPAVDGNARRVVARLFDLEAPTAGELERLARILVPPQRPGDFNQALMELGSMICRPRRPACGECPLAAQCLARRRGTLDARPGARPARSVPEYGVGTAVVVTQDRHVLLAKRPEKGLLPGMWEFPGAIARDGETPAAAARRGARALLGASAPRLSGEPFAIVPYRFSHRRHVYHAFRLPLSGDPLSPIPTPAWTAAEWVSVDLLERRALPAAQRQIARAVIAGPGYPSAP